MYAIAGARSLNSAPGGTGSLARRVSATSRSSSARGGPRSSISTGTSSTAPGSVCTARLFVRSGPATIRLGGMGMPWIGGGDGVAISEAPPLPHNQL